LLLFGTIGGNGHVASSEDDLKRTLPNIVSDNNMT